MIGVLVQRNHQKRARTAECEWSATLLTYDRRPYHSDTTQRPLYSVPLGCARNMTGERPASNEHEPASPRSAQRQGTCVSERHGDGLFKNETGQQCTGSLCFWHKSSSRKGELWQGTRDRRYRCAGHLRGLCHSACGPSHYPRVVEPSMKLAPTIATPHLRCRLTAGGGVSYTWDRKCTNA